MPIVPDIRYSGRAVAGPVNQNLLDAVAPAEPEQSDGALNTLAAAARQTLPGATYNRLTTPDPDLPATPPNWDALDNLSGYEEFAHRAVNISSPSELAGWKQRIDGERADRATLHRAGWSGVAAEIGMTVLDPSFLASIAVPELALVRGARTARGIQAAIEGAAVGGTYEAGMQALQETRSPLDALASIGGGALLGGVLGTVGRSAGKSEVASVRKVVDNDMTLPLDELQRSEAGAAAAARPTTLKAESLAPGGALIARLETAIPGLGTDLSRVMRGESIVAKQTLQDLADVPGLLGKNFEGVASPASIESFVQRWDAQLADFSDLMHTKWMEYRAKGIEDGLTREQFYANVSGASRRADVHAIPEVAEAAGFLRSKIFDPLKEQAQKLGMLSEKVDALGADSYFRRMYDREAIRGNRAAWDQLLLEHFVTGGGSPVEARAAADDVTRKILGGDIGQANFSTAVSVAEAGPLKERVLDIRDELLEPFLVNDPQRVASAYVKDLAPQVEIAKRFGDREMKDQLSKITQEYDIKREQVRQAAGEADTSPRIAALDKEEKHVLEALVRVRDRVLGTAGRVSGRSEGATRAVAAARGWRNIVASAKLGGTAITGGAMDTARIAAQYGFTPTLTKLTRLLASPTARSLSKSQARRVGSAVEAALSRRVNAAFDGAVTEGWTQKLANGVYKWTGLNHITDFNRTLGASLFEDRVARIANGGRTNSFERARMASLGLGEDELRRVAEQIERHGGEVDGVYVSGSADWDDKALADIYDAAILRESKIIVQQPGAADRVWWLDSETGKFFGQLKTFAMSAPQRLLIQPAQMVAHGDYLRAARFVGMMMMGGYLTHSMRQLAAGRLPSTDVKSAANEAFAETGLAGVLPDIVSPFARRLGLGESVRFADRNAVSAFGGPALGAATDLYDIVYNRTQGGISARDLQAIRRMLPWQNAWMFRRGVNALEGELAESLDLKGSDHATFMERVTRTDAVLPSAQRGGTGTGVAQ